MAYDTDQKISNLRNTLDDRIFSIQDDIAKIRNVVTELSVSFKIHLPYLARREDITTEIRLHENNCPFAKETSKNRARVVKLSAILASVSAAIGGFIVFVLETFFRR